MLSRDQARVLHKDEIFMKKNKVIHLFFTLKLQSIELYLSKDARVLSRYLY